MASSKAYLDYVLENINDAEVTYRPMMGEYLLYYRGKLIGGIYDDRFLVKVTKSALGLMPNAERTLPYEGAKEMLLVTETEDREFLSALLGALYADLPDGKRK